jgi:amino acid transporter
VTAVGAPSLARVLRRRDLVAFAINGVIGAGIFGIPAVLYARVGSLSWAAMLLAAAVVMIITLCFAEVGSAYTETGGPYLYARDVFGPAAGFQVGWLMWVARLSGFGAVTNLFVSYIAYFAPGAANGAGRVALIVSVVAALTAVNYIGIRRAATVNNVLTLAKLVPLVLFVVVGLFHVDWTRLAPAATVRVQPLFGAMMLAIYAFSGFELLAVPGGEIRDPERAIPFSLLTGLAFVTAVYVGVQVVCVGTLPSLGGSSRPLADAAAATLGGAAGTFMVIGALLSTFGVSHTIILAAARLPFAMAEQGQLPPWMAAVHPRFRTPHVSLLVSAGCILAITLATSFISAATLTVGLRVLVYLITCAALPAMRRRLGGPTATFRVPAGNIVAAASVLICVALLVIRPWSETRQLLLTVTAGFLLYLSFNRRRPGALPSPR